MTELSTLLKLLSPLAEQLLSAHIKSGDDELLKTANAAIQFYALLNKTIKAYPLLLGGNHEINS